MDFSLTGELCVVTNLRVFPHKNQTVADFCDQRLRQRA
jgi:hypothetical protein